MNLDLVSNYTLFKKQMFFYSVSEENKSFLILDLKTNLYFEKQNKNKWHLLFDVSAAGYLLPSSGTCALTDSLKFLNDGGF